MPAAGMPGRLTFWPVFKLVPHFTHMMARGETSLPQFGQVGFSEVATLGAGGGAVAVAALRIANAGAGGGGAATLDGVGTVIGDWQAGQGICMPAYSGPH